jgi:hypothetical protein
MIDFKSMFNLLVTYQLSLDLWTHVYFGKAFDVTPIFAIFFKLGFSNFGNHIWCVIFENETAKFFQKKYAQYLKSVKEPKIRMGATRRNLQAQPKGLKKWTEHQIYQPKRNFS